MAFFQELFNILQLFVLVKRITTSPLVKPSVSHHNKVNERLLTLVFLQLNLFPTATGFEVKFQASELFIFEDCPHKSCSFDQLLLMFRKILFFLKFNAFVDGTKEDQNRESIKSNEYAYNFEEVFIDLEVVDTFEKLSYLMLVVTEFMLPVNFVMHYSLHLITHIENSK